MHVYMPDTNMSTPVKINLEWLGLKWIKWCIILALVLICSLHLSAVVDVLCFCCDCLCDNNDDDHHDDDDDDDDVSTPYKCRNLAPAQPRTTCTYLCWKTISTSSCVQMDHPCHLAA